MEIVAFLVAIAILLVVWRMASNHRERARLERERNDALDRLRDSRQQRVAEVRERFVRNNAVQTGVRRDLINKQRQAAGRPPLTSSQIQQGMREHSNSGDDLTNFLIGYATGIPLSPMGLVGSMLHNEDRGSTPLVSRPQGYSISQSSEAKTSADDSTSGVASASSYNSDSSAYSGSDSSSSTSDPTPSGSNE